jgi:hypothetical protein
MGLRPQDFKSLMGHVAGRRTAPATPVSGVKLGLPCRPDTPKTAPLCGACAALVRLSAATMERIVIGMAMVVRTG